MNVSPSTSDDDNSARLSYRFCPKPGDKYGSGLAIGTGPSSQHRGRTNSGLAKHVVLETKYSRLRLFKLDMSANGSLRGQVKFELISIEIQDEFGFYLAYLAPGSDLIEYQYIMVDPSDALGTAEFIVRHEVPDSRLIELGVYYAGKVNFVESITLFHISTIVIMPKDEYGRNSEPLRIKNIKVVQRTSGEHYQKRIAWELEEKVEAQIPKERGIPWSNITGPFASFDVHIRGKHAGRAYCLESPLLEGDLNSEDNGGDIDVVVHGHLFGGGITSSEITTFPRDAFQS